jgi:inner membrane transporter RhtA
MKFGSLSLSILTLLIAMASIQVGAALAKQLFPSVGAVGATSLRLFFAAAILICVWRPWRERLTRTDIKPICIYGAALGLMNLLFYLSLERIPLGITVALEFTGPLAVALYSSRKALDLLWVALAVLGIYFILPLKAAQANADPIGMVFALAAGACWATYIVFGKRAGSVMHGGRVAALGMLVASLVVIPFGVAFSGTLLLNTQVLPLAIAVAVLSSALPYSLEMISLKRLPAETFGILMSLEPALAALSGILILGETLTMLQCVAIACVIIASFGSSLSFAKKDAPKDQAPDILGD